MKISSIKDQNTISIFAFILFLIIFVSIGYSIGGLIGIFLGLAITLILSTYLKYFLIRTAGKDKSKGREIKTDEIESPIDEEIIHSDEKEESSEDEKRVESTDRFDFKETTPSMKGGQSESQGYSIESGSGAGKLQLRKNDVVSKQRIRSSKGIFNDTSVEDIKKMSTKELLELIKNGKGTDKKLEFLETVIWELNNLENYEKFTSLIRIAEHMHKSGMKSGARSLYKNLEITCKNIEDIEIKSDLFKDLAVMFSEIGNIKKSVKYFKNGFDLCLNIDDLETKTEILTGYIQASKNEKLPKLANSILNHNLSLIAESSGTKIPIKGRIVSDILDTLVETDGSKLDRESIRNIKNTLDGIELDDMNYYFGKLMIITAKEGYQDLYDDLISEVPSVHKKTNELFYEIPYENLGRNILMNYRYETAVEYRNFVPSEYEENYNQGFVKGLIEKGDLKEAYQDIQKMEVLNDKELLSEITKRIADLGDLKQSQRIAERYRLTDTAETIALEMVKQGDLKGAMDLIEELNSDEKYKIDTEVGFELGKDGKFIKARHRFESAEEQISGLQNIKKRINGYMSLAKKMNMTLKKDDSLEILKNALYHAEDIGDISRVFGTIVSCGYEKEAFDNALNVRKEENRAKILERMAVEIILSTKEVPKDIINLIKTVENKKYDLGRDRDIFENIAISLLEEKDHIDEMFRIGDIYRKFKEDEKNDSVTDNKKLEIIASWAKTKRKEVEDQE